jgi:hypothetical protein
VCPRRANAAWTGGLRPLSEREQSAPPGRIPAEPRRFKQPPCRRSRCTGRSRLSLAGRCLAGATRSSSTTTSLRSGSEPARCAARASSWMTTWFAAEAASSTASAISTPHGEPRGATRRCFRLLPVSSSAHTAPSRGGRRCPRRERGGRRGQTACRTPDSVPPSLATRCPRRAGGASVTSKDGIGFQRRDTAESERTASSSRGAQSLHQPMRTSPSPLWRGPKASISSPSDPASNCRVTSGATRSASSLSISTISSSSLTRPEPAMTT